MINISPFEPLESYKKFETAAEELNPLKTSIFQEKREINLLGRGDWTCVLSNALEG